MKKISLLLGLCFISALLFGQSISGYVKDEKNKPLAGANIQIKSLSKGEISDGNGYFELNGLKKGEFILVISFLGYKNMEQIVSVEDQPIVLNFQLAEDNHLLQEVNVISTWAGEKTPISYKNIDKKSLEKNNLGQDLPFLLNTTPSVVINSDAGAGVGYTGIRVRGTDPTRINITINGIPINDAESQSMYWVNMPDIASSTQNIQIQRGVGTSTNGAGAFGATINLSTANVSEKPSLTLSNSVGSFNTLKNGLQFSSGKLKDKFVIDGRLSRIVSDGYIDRASSNLRSAYLSAAYLGNKSALRFTAFSGNEKTYQAWNGVPAQYINDSQLRTYNPSGTEKSGEPYDNEIDNYTQHYSQLHYDQVLSPVWDLDVALHYTKGFGYYEQYKASQKLANYFIQSTTEKADLVRQLWLDNDFYGSIFSLKYKNSHQTLSSIIGGAYNIYAGDHFGKVVKVIDVQDVSLDEHFYDNNALKKDANLYSKTQYQINTLLNAFLDVQYRNVIYNTKGLNREQRDITQNVTYNFFNPKMGFFFDFDKKNKAFASFAVANREPNRDDIIDNFKGEQPHPETLYDTEIGYKFNAKKIGFNANLYYMNYKNQLVLTGQINSVGAVTRINVPKSYRTGLELELNYQFLPKWQWNINTTFSRNKIQVFEEYIDNWDTGAQEKIEHKNSDLSFSPNVIMGSELQWNVLNTVKNKLNLSLLGKYVGKQYIDNTSNENTKLDPYFTTDFRINYQLFTKKPLNSLALNLLVNNIFNTQYSSNAWTYRYTSPSYNPVADDPYNIAEGNNRYSMIGYFPQAGTNFLLGLNITF